MLTSLFCIIQRSDVLERVEILESLESLIGRSESCDIWLPNEVVSRRHAVVRRKTDCATIQDLGSRNQTLVRGRIVQGEVTLDEGDQVQIGPYTLVICYTIGNAIAQSINVTDSTKTDQAPPLNGGETQSPLSAWTPALTPAQRRVFDGFLEGLSEKEVANRLGISIHTVHTHAKAIYKSFQISSRAELLRRTADQDGHY